MSRRKFLSAAAALPVAASLAGCRLPGVTDAGGRKRSIVFILTDDQRWDSMGCMGHPFLKTPNMDRLAAEGAHGLNTFVTTSLCSSSRASMLSGQYTHRHGIVRNGIPLPAGLLTYPELLKKAGYETAYVGKWHMGENTDDPRPHWNHWAGFAGQGEYINPMFNINGQRRRIEGYVTDIISNQATAWLDSVTADRPFCLAIGHKGTHALWEPPPRHRDLFKDVPIPEPMANTEASYRNVPLWVRRQRFTPHGVDNLASNQLTWEQFYLNYHRCLVSVDESVGRILAALEARDLLDSTLVVYTSDNGFLHGEHGLIDKRCMYEESIRIPLLVRCPEIIPAGRKIHEMILNIDLPSMLLETAGMTPPPSMQGTSFLPLLRGDPLPWRRSFLYQYFFSGMFPMTPTVLGVRTDRYKYMDFHGIFDNNELYDLQEDPGEKRNLFREPGSRQLLAEMSKELNRLLEEFGCQREPAWNAG